MLHNLLVQLTPCQLLVVVSALVHTLGHIHKVQV
jgi:hypothetical protein